MYSKPIALLKEDDAVSPVIGVILMVAITVILAAVIAAFVLGIGDTDDVAPQTTFDSDFSDGEVVIEVVSGDAIEVDDFELRGAQDGSDYADWDCDAPNGDDLANCAGPDPDSSFTPGDGETVDVGESFALSEDTGAFSTADGTVEVNLVWVGDGEDIIKTIEGDI